MVGNQRSLLVELADRRTRGYTRAMRWQGLAALAALALMVGCGDTTASDNESPAAAGSPSTKAAPDGPSREAVRAERCARQTHAVDDYDITTGSRSGYLEAVHRFQAQCPAEATKAGLDATELPPCKPQQLENCSAHPKAGEY